MIYTLDESIPSWSHGIEYRETGIKIPPNTSLVTLKMIASAPMRFDSQLVIRYYTVDTSIKVNAGADGSLAIRPQAMEDAPNHIIKVLQSPSSHLSSPSQPQSS